MKTYSTKEVVAITGLDRSTIFRWEREGTIAKPKRNGNGYRSYGEKIVEQILRLSGKSRHEIYALVNQKGGTGKTTITQNLGACLAELNQKVLIVDLDCQANLTYSLGYDLPDEQTKNTYHLLTHLSTKVSDIVVATKFPNLYLAPGSIVLANADFDLRQIVMGEDILRKKLEEARKDYNYILLDCPPSLSPIVGAGVLAADGLIVPVPLQQFSLVGLKNLIEFLSVILQRTKTTDQSSVHILPNMVDDRHKISHTMFAELKQNFPGEILPAIRISSALPDAQAHRCPVVHYKRSCRGSMDFRRLADYMLKEVKAVL